MPSDATFSMHCVAHRCAESLARYHPDCTRFGRATTATMAAQFTHCQTTTQHGGTFVAGNATAADNTAAAPSGRPHQHQVGADVCSDGTAISGLALQNVTRKFSNALNLRSVDGDKVKCAAQD